MGRHLKRQLMGGQCCRTGPVAGRGCGAGQRVSAAYNKIQHVGVVCGALVEKIAGRAGAPIVAVGN